MYQLSEEEKKKRAQIVARLLSDSTPSKASKFPTWGIWLIAGILIATILFFGIGAIRRMNNRSTQ